MNFRNPENGYEEESSAPWLLALMFGPLYFAVKGIWTHAIVLFLLTFMIVAGLGIVALFALPIVAFLYAVFANDIVRGSYLRKGWVEVVPGATPIQKSKKCPFCAESIKPEAVVCRYCGKELPEEDEE